MQYAKANYLYEVKRGKYFRLVALVVADGERPRYLLLAGRLVRRYDGEPGA